MTSEAMFSERMVESARLAIAKRHCQAMACPPTGEWCDCRDDARAALEAAERERELPSEDEIAELIAEHVTIGYEFAPLGEGVVNPHTIRVFDASAAAAMVLHRLRPAIHDKTEG
jgi:AcrR family transcriptional regulator